MTTAISSYICAKAAKGESSRIQGRGLFATAPIAAGEIVAIKGGHIVTTAALHGLPDRLRNSEIQIADGFHLVAKQDSEYEPVMLFLNHSCEPNVGFLGNVVLVAMRDVEQGEELTTDYALFDDYDGTMECRCGAPSCRGTVSAGTGSAQTCSASTAATSPPTSCAGCPASQTAGATPGESYPGRRLHA
jgi:hypothetical protein